MITIGVPAEGPDEPRIGLSPETAKKLVKLGAKVLLSSGAGLRSHFSDQEYKDAGAEIVRTRPGLLQAKFRPTANPSGLMIRLFAKNSGDAITLDLNLDRPNAAENRLVVTAVFRVPGGGAPRNKPAWSSRCLTIFEEMRRYLMAAR
jgi:hypothetical protein